MLGPSTSERLLAVYKRLLDAYGPQQWWPGDGEPFVVVAGAILTQSTAWANVDRALDALRARGLLSPAALSRISEEELAEVVRPAGYFRMKARKLKAFVDMLDDRFDGRLEALFALPIEEMRATLLVTYGIGPETADDIILYAARKPVFVIDAYTRRVFGRLGLQAESGGYDSWRSFFMDALPHDSALYKEYHALIVRHAKVTCRRQPLCARCALLAICPTGRAILAGRSDVEPGKRLAPAERTRRGKMLE